MSVDLLVETFSLFVVIQLSNPCKSVCCCLAAVSCLGCCEGSLEEYMVLSVGMGMLQGYHCPSFLPYPKGKNFMKEEGNL